MPSSACHAFLQHMTLEVISRCLVIARKSYELLQKGRNRLETSNWTTLTDSEQTSVIFKKLYFWILGEFYEKTNTTILCFDTSFRLLKYVI